jgi:hypothetical protein
VFPFPCFICFHSFQIVFAFLLFFWFMFVSCFNFFYSYFVYLHFIFFNAFIYLFIYSIFFREASYTVPWPPPPKTLERSLSCSEFPQVWTSLETQLVAATAPLGCCICSSLGLLHMIWGVLGLPILHLNCAILELAATAADQEADLAPSPALSFLTIANRTPLSWEAHDKNDHKTN